MPGEAEDERRRTMEAAVANGMEAARQSSRSTKRNMLLIVAIVVAVVIARQSGYFGETYQGQPLERIPRTQFDAELAALPLVPALDVANRGEQVVEFFDYRCAPCRTMAPVLQDILAQGAEMELVPIELPQLGPESELAARYALAASLQGGYAPFHRALMFSTVPFTPEGLADLGAALGLDPVRLAADAAGEQVSAALEANRQLAASIGVAATPAFVIGDIVVVGAIDEASLLGLVAAAHEAQ